MGLFSKTKGKQYLLYSEKTRELDIEGLNASLPESYSGLKIGLGKLKIKPNLVEISDKLRQFDAMQASIKVDIDTIKDPVKKDELTAQCVEVKLKMMALASQAIGDNSLEKKSISNSIGTDFSKKKDNQSVNLYDFFKNAKFEISNFLKDDFTQPGKIIWPVVLQDRPTIIHKAQIEAIRILVSNKWELHIIIADCGSNTQTYTQKVSFKSELLRQLMKRKVSFSDINFLSDYYSSSPSIGADILQKFTDISSSLKTKELMRYNIKEGSYSQEKINKIEERNALKFIQPLLTWSVILHISENYNRDFNKKSIVIAGQDELNQWKFIFNKSSFIGGLFNPKLMNDENHIVFQEDQPMIFHNEREVLSVLDVGNLAKWLFNSFVILPNYPEPPKDLVFCKECKRKPVCDSCLFTNNEDSKLPDFVDKNKYVDSFWEIVGAS